MIILIHMFNALRVKTRWRVIDAIPMHILNAISESTGNKAAIIPGYRGVYSHALAQRLVQVHALSPSTADQIELPAAGKPNGHIPSQLRASVCAVDGYGTPLCEEDDWCRENAVRAGVEDIVEIRSTDFVRLPFADASCALVFAPYLKHIAYLNRSQERYDSLIACLID